jgi:Ca2+-binding RTX toxin-like protein
MSNLTKTASSTQTVTTNMTAGNDVITGSVLAETFAFNGATGWLGTDSIAGGGTGIDLITTNDTTVTEVGSGNASTGVVVNLGSTAVSNVNVLLNASGHLGGTSTAVSAGTIQYMYAAADTTNVNSSIADTVSGIENYTSTDGINYVVGNSSANTITLGAGADYVDAGSGNDTITGGAGVDKLLGGIGEDNFLYTVQANLVAGSAVVDTITGGSGTADAIVINNNGLAGFTVALGDALTRVTTVEVIKAGGATDQVISLTLAATAASVSGIKTVDLSLDTDNSANNVINVDAITGAGNGFTLKGGAGTDTITGTDFADIITGGAGNDIINGGSGIDRIVFSETNGQDAVTFVRNSDLLDFSGVTAQGTIAEVAITNDTGTALGATTLTGNTTVYYIDTDATELGSALTTPVGTFNVAGIATWLNLDDGFVASGTAGNTNYIVINDASITTAGYVVKHTDDGDATVTIEDTELSIVAVTAHGAGALDVDDGVIA